ncbi:histidinol-phosphate transaminase [candidate division WOR-3 bacterium JGI_Cruoil_03_51_56]|uniref:Histidinol-phosphate aminotransferase n=1 Tax=candidate division WOR-3 bacterium JGI_Cruoil_03_51_56 TaxID=1973747 RepID=A0A235BQ47_UNCW3|nr:MAG: histidinol-phosphate transaminase [candidate division WOR-3 bacterium JGI_Cruoil_03_51_56]
MLPVSRSSIGNIKPYKPGKPIEQVVRELGLKGTVDKLASNENPLGPSPKAVAALRKELRHLHYYPEDSCHYLRERLARRFKVDMDSVIIGNGSVELLLFACLVYLNPGDELIMSTGSFIMPKIGTKLMDGRVVEVPTKEYVHDLGRILGNITRQTKIIYLDNPMNPLGTMVTKNELDEFITQVPENILVIIDEAYAEYITTRKYPKSLNYYNANRSVFILHTFSKAYGLAGLRIGYGIARPDIVETISKARLPFNVNRAAQVAALAALEDKAYVNKSRKNNDAGKKMLYKEFERLKLFYIPSFTNFVFVNFAVDSSLVFEELQQRGIITRPVKQYGFPNALRVTVGTPKQNKRFISALTAVLNELQG